MAEKQPPEQEVDKNVRKQRAFYQRQKERGLVRISVYVPDADRDAFWDAVDKLRDRWHAMGLPY